jgi:hypothetical protein
LVYNSARPWELQVRFTWAVKKAIVSPTTKGCPVFEALSWLNLGHH